MSWDKVVKILAAIAGGVAGMLGEWDIMLTVLACFMVIDYLTGLAVAWRKKSPKSENGGVSSKAGLDGLVKKFFLCVMVLVAALLDTALGNTTHVFRLAAAMYYTANEGISILENTALMGVPYPSFIVNALEVMKDQSDPDNKGKEDKSNGKKED